MGLTVSILSHLRLPWNACISSMSSHKDPITTEEVADRILSVVKGFRKVDPSKVNPFIHFEKDLGLNSFDIVELVVLLEQEFKVELPDKEADKIDSCPRAIKHFSNHLMCSD